MIPAAAYAVEAYDCNFNVIEQVLDAKAIRRVLVTLKEGYTIVRCLNGTPKIFVVTKQELVEDFIKNCILTKLTTEYVNEKTFGS